jgi:hypothetical protein
MKISRSSVYKHEPHTTQDVPLEEAVHTGAMNDEVRNM